MSKLICLQHPKYAGKESPVLSCKTCCGIFVSQIREDNLAADTEEAKREQRRQNVIKRRAAATSAAKGQIGFNPDLI